MRDYDAATTAYLSGRGGIVSRQMIWIAARNVASGLVETLGLWTGEEDYTTTIDAETRTYVGAGTLLQSEPITAGAGIAVRIHQLQMSAIAPEVEALVKDYDTRFAPIEMHRAFFDPETRQLVAAPHRVFRGLINSIDFATAQVGGNASCTIDMVSETRMLTRTIGLKKSDESQKLRGGDRFRRYGDISGAVPVYWNELRAE